MELAEVNNHDAAKLLFDRYNIPYEIITRGENKGKLRVKTVRGSDMDRAQPIMDAVRRAVPALYDHVIVFRDANDHVIITFSPYSLLKPGKYEIQGVYGVEANVEAVYQHVRNVTKQQLEPAILDLFAFIQPLLRCD